MAVKNKSMLAFLKLLIFLFLVSGSYHVSAQKSIFVRVFNLSGKKIHKGYVHAVTDSSLQLIGINETINIPGSKIGSIRTKRSAGSNIFIGSAIGGVAGGIIGATTADSGNSFTLFTQGEATVFGAALGASIGSIIGGLTSLFKHSKQYSIKGDKTKWTAFQLMINQTTP